MAFDITNPDTAGDAVPAQGQVAFRLEFQRPMPFADALDQASLHFEAPLEVLGVSSPVNPAHAWVKAISVNAYGGADGFDAYVEIKPAARAYRQIYRPQRRARLHVGPRRRGRARRRTAGSRTASSRGDPSRLDAEPPLAVAA